MDGRDHVGTKEMSESNHDDRFLAERYLRDRDEESFRALYRRHTPALYRIGISLTGNADAAADVVQETWLRAARRLDSFRWSSALGTWLAGIAINCCRESWRNGEPFPDDRNAVPVRPAREDRVDLVRAIRDLPDGSRAVLMLHEVFGHTHAEIATILEIDEGTSKSQLSYSRKLMRRWFERRSSRTGGNDVER